MRSVEPQHLRDVEALPGHPNAQKRPGRCSIPPNVNIWHVFGPISGFLYGKPSDFRRAWLDRRRCIRFVFVCDIFSRQLACWVEGGPQVQRLAGIKPRQVNALTAMLAHISPSLSVICTFLHSLLDL